MPERRGPHRDLRQARVRYLIGVKPGDHAFLFQHLRDADEAGRTQHLTQVDPAIFLVESLLPVSSAAAFLNH